MRKTILATGILLLMLGLGTADTVFVEGGLPSIAVPDSPDSNQPPTPQVSNALTSSVESASSPSTPVEHTDASTASATSSMAIRKIQGPDVAMVLERFALTTTTNDELSILRTVIPVQQDTVHTLILLQNEDRAGAISWTESIHVKNYFLALKEALHASFSPRVKDLIDETQMIPGKPPRNFLTFFDEGISAERMVFLRVRERLYEIRIAEGHDELMFKLIDALTE